MWYVHRCLVSCLAKSTWPNAITWHRIESSSAQVVLCCLMTPSHYLNQCSLKKSEVQWPPHESRFTTGFPVIILKNLKIIYLKCHSNLSGTNHLMGRMFTDSRLSHYSLVVHRTSQYVRVACRRYQISIWFCDDLGFHQRQHVPTYHRCHDLA